MNSSGLWRSAALIVNSHSRRGTRLFGVARDKLRQAGVPLVREVAERDPSKMRARVEEAVASGVELIIVGGGDGSISGTIGALMDTECTFAALPLGTANSFARTLGIGADLDEAVAAIANGESQWVDLAELDGHMFANSAAIGLSPIIGDTIPPRLKRYLGRFGYLVWALRTMTRFRPFRLEIDCDGQQHRCWATEVRLLNGRYAGGIELSEDADLDSGEIVVQVITGRSRFRLALDWYRRIFGLTIRDCSVLELHGRRVRVATRPVQKVSIDGEVLARTPFALLVHRRAVRVAVANG